MTQKERQERSREEIYQAALEEFGTSGYDKVNMERICGNHGISKGMMYHYYSGKDALFLLCVERTFADLEAYVEQNAKEPRGRDILDDIKGFFLLREQFFQQHPRQKAIFETAMLHPPKQLADQIRQMRVPIRNMNRRFLQELVRKVPLRPGVEPEQAIRYLESVGYFFQNAMMFFYQSGKAGNDLRALLEHTGEMLDLFLFGVLQRPDGCSGSDQGSAYPAADCQLDPGAGDCPHPAGSGGAPHSKSQNQGGTTC